jgi:hypothetical protein
VSADHDYLRPTWGFPSTPSNSVSGPPISTTYRTPTLDSGPSAEASLQQYETGPFPMSILDLC